MKNYFFLIGIGFLLTGCCTKSNASSIPLSNNKNVVKKQINNSLCFIDNSLQTQSCILKIEGSGEGVVPTDAVSMSQAKVMARRAAILDAYRNLAEKLYGVRIEGKDTVKNMILQNSTLRSYVQGLIKGAVIEEENYKDGTYSVVLSVKLNPQEWNKYLNQ
ncbi:hypothetical protein FE773_06400 [Caminibacter mediatlanticus TB-2]|uniref:Lipoprotein LPP20-like domain-containing protein n=1 Tax=Caminibacter mediatlanticus TB-2 TaxID=391592 RepID=A0ABX5V951_9BACT|nr:LPP20 family lipoprotein [Caminibacter mediatlanticus]QCT94825.1 hypothetical protein FE773_06400 [Caminibacter mediatlanticus TB-2]